LKQVGIVFLTGRKLTRLAKDKRKNVWKNMES
jgi:hypothetical protein